MKKRKIIVISSLLILLLVGVSFTSIYILQNKNTNDHSVSVENDPIKEDKKEELEENSKNEEIQKTEEKQEDVKADKPKEEVVTSKKEEPKNTISNTNTSNTSTTPKTNVDNNTTYQQPSQDVPASQPKEEIKEEPKPTPSSTNETKSNVGVPDPNNYNYSMHHGTIEYNPNQRQKCIDDSIEFSFKDTIDITNAFCLEVYDSSNTILGYYLYIKCNSGNCNKYKN